MKQFLTLFILLLSPLVSSLAQKNTQLTRLEQERKQALLEISTTDKLLQETKKTTTTLLSRIQLISNQLEARQKVINLLGREVATVERQQAAIEEDIKQLEAQLEEKKQSYAQAIDGMQAKRKGQNKVLFVISGHSLSESYRRFQYLKEYSTWISTQADVILAHKEELKLKESDLANTKYEKVALLRQRERERENLLKEEENFNKEKDEVARRQKDLQKQLAQQKKLAQSIDKKITKIVEEDIKKQQALAKKEAQAKAKAREREKAKAQAQQKNESTGTKPTVVTPPKVEDKAEESTISTEENLRLSKNFATNRGKLPAPITGNYSVTAHFGNQHYKEWKVVTYNSGIELQSQRGASARAVFDGEVTKVVALSGANNGIVIRHGNYYTFYVNLKTVSVKQGETVKTGQLLGTVYTDPDTNVSQLHFEISKGITKLNPEPWIRR